MKTINIDTHKYSERFAKLSSILNTPVLEDCEEHSLTFDDYVGKGTMRGIDFEHGLSLFMIDAELKQDLIFNYNLGRRHPIQFLYVAEGKLEIHTEGEAAATTVERGEAIINAPAGRNEYQIAFKSGRKVQAIYVDVVRFLFYNKISCDVDTIPKTLKEMFADTVGEKLFQFKSVTDPMISTTLMALFKSEQSGLERKMLIEAKVLTLISSLIERYRVEEKYEGISYRLGIKDIKLINDAKSHIFANIERTPTVKELALEVGLNVNKLQKGFKMLFGKSIRQFTISLKLHYALSLLDEGELTISEVAYKIGYTNKGHFSQLFKKEFGVLPSVYTQQASLIGAEF